MSKLARLFEERFYIVYHEGSGLTFKRKSIYVFSVDYGCYQR